MPSQEAERHDADIDLLLAVSAGKATAVRKLLDEIAPLVYGYLFARVGGDQSVAEDLLQETLLEAVRSAGTFRGDAALSTWLCAIARRRLARYYETERKAEVARRGLYAVTQTTDESDYDSQDEVIRALGRLSPLHRQILILKYMDGRTVEEIATQVGRSRVQVQSLLQRARDGLRRQLEDSDA